MYPRERRTWKIVRPGEHRFCSTEAVLDLENDRVPAGLRTCCVAFEGFDGSLGVDLEVPDSGAIIGGFPGTVFGLAVGLEGGIDFCIGGNVLGLDLGLGLGLAVGFIYKL
jgi:hypothetical protein